MDRNTRIAILGGGPAGLSAAMYLEKKGYENYTVFEKNNRVGGKCYSPKYKDGRAYEMGAIMGCPTYFAVQEVMDFTGYGVDGPALVRQYKNKDGKVIDPFSTKNVLNLPHLLRMKNHVKKLCKLLQTKYVGYDINGHRGISQGRYDGYAATKEHQKVSGENPNLKDLMLSFDEFCRINGVEGVKDLWIGPYTSFGYGYFDEIPAAYVLKYLDFDTMMDFMYLRLWTWKDGTQSIWDHLNDKLKHPALLNQEVTKVERHDGKVYITAGNEAPKEFDKLIVTTPLPYFAEYADASAAEKELFSKIDYERYDSMAVEMKPENIPDTSYYIFENMQPERLGHLMVYYKRWKTDDKNQPITTYTLRNHKGQKVLDYEGTKKQVLEDLKTMSNPAENVILECENYYFPHIFTEDYQAGWYEKVEGMQGENNTFYAGEIMSFGDMEEVAEYSRDLVERFFAD